jgi:CRP-like cAMP-binding protein
MRNHDPKLTLLRNVTFLRNCPEKDLARLAAQMEECEVPAGHVLMHEGDAGRQAFVVVDGWAAVSCEGTAIAAIGPGEFIGEMAMLTHEPRSATVTAKTNMRVLVLGPAVFHAVACEPTVGRAMAACLAQRLRDVEAQL